MTVRRDRKRSRWTTGGSAATNAGPYLVALSVTTATLPECKCGCGHVKGCPGRAADGENETKND